MIEPQSGFNKPLALVIRRCSYVAPAAIQIQPYGFRAGVKISSDRNRTLWKSSNSQFGGGQGPAIRLAQKTLALRGVLLRPRRARSYTENYSWIRLDIRESDPYGCMVENDD